MAVSLLGSVLCRVAIMVALEVGVTLSAPVVSELENTLLGGLS